MTQHDATYFVYILASQPHGTLYIGVTNDLRRRLEEHRAGEGGVFTKRYGVKTLVWHELHGDALTAIQREKSLKRWPRDWKQNLIERDNPHWQDLYPTLLDAG
jgi:putative endonuclease